MRLAIVGSTNITPAQSDIAYWLIDLILVRYIIEFGVNLQVVSGGANGIDHIGQWSAEDGGVSTKIFEPDIDKWESDYIDGTEIRGFKSRNMQVAEYCDELVCVRTIQSKTYGSGWTADRAEEMGKNVYRLTLP